MGSCYFWLSVALIPILLVFFSAANGREYILEMWCPKAAILCSMGWFERKLIVDFKVCFLTCYCQVKKVYRHVLMCGIEFYVIMYLIYVCIDGAWVSSCCVVYVWDVIDIYCV